MRIREFDRVLLQTGETASIAEIYEPGVAYEADIDTLDGHIRTDLIRQSDIARVLTAKKADRLAS